MRPVQRELEEPVEAQRAGCGDLVGDVAQRSPPGPSASAAEGTGEVGQIAVAADQPGHDAEHDRRDAW